MGGGIVRGRMYRIDWYPALILGGDGQVRGEVYEVDSEHLGRLDDFEGVGPGAPLPLEYERVRVDVDMDDGEAEECWVWNWIGELPGEDALMGGDWLEAEPNPS